MKPDPILIAAPTRCGTTMLAWLLHLHGIWIGDGQVTKSPQTNPQVPTENTAIKDYLRGISGTPADFRERMLERVETDGRWLVKTALNLEKQDAWIKAFPDAKWLLPWRPFDDCVASKMRHPGMMRRGAGVNEERTRRHMSLQYRVIETARHSALLSADALCSGGAEGEYEARAAFDFAGVRLDARIYHDWVKPERWHGAKSGAARQ